MVQKDAKGRGYSIFRSAAEEAATKTGDTLRRDDEGGHMSCRSGRIVSRPGAGMPFTAVMTREDGTTFVRRNTPAPSARSTTYDHNRD